MSSISTVLKKKRKELGLTLAQIANEMGVTEATVQRWESGNIKTLRHGRITKLADILHVSPAYLMGWEESEAQLKAAGLSIEDISFETGIPPEEINKIINGERNNDAISKIIEVAQLLAKYTNDTKKSQDNPSAQSKINHINDDDIKFALFGGDGEITDEMYEEVKKFAQFIKQKEREKGNGKSV